MLSLLLTGSFAVIYYFIVISSNGSEHIVFIEPEEQYTSFAELVNHPELKDKVIYVDYWYTSCAPCVKEFEYLPELKSKFKNNDDLVFLYLGKDRSTPGEKFRWKKMIEGKDLQGYHYFMSREMYDKIWEETVNDDSIFKAFPHYLIVDRSGKVINRQAPRPSSKAVEDALSQALSYR